MIWLSIFVIVVLVTLGDDFFWGGLFMRRSVLRLYGGAVLGDLSGKSLVHRKFLRLDLKRDGRLLLWSLVFSAMDLIFCETGHAPSVRWAG